MKQKPSATTNGSCNTLSRRQLERVIFQRYSVEIVENLDVSEIFTHLNSQGLLTRKDRQMLLKDITSTEKAQYLLDALPRKEEFFDKFLKCVHQTTDGTGHMDIIRALSANCREVMEGNFQAAGLITPPDLYQSNQGGSYI